MDSRRRHQAEGCSKKARWQELDAVAALIPDRSKSQCRGRWHNGLDASVEGATRCTGKWKWTAVEDSKLKDAVPRHGGKDWKEIAMLFPDRTTQQCRDRWRNTRSLSSSSIDQANGRTGKWAEDEDIKLEDAVKRHCGKDWVAISALVPCRTKNQCR
jgi:hypothetical protein